MKKNPEAYFQQNEYNMPRIFGMQDFDRNNVDKESSNIKKKDKLIAKRNIKLKK